MVGEKKWVPYVVLTPWIIGFFIFKLYPFINSFYLSLFEKRGLSQTYVGLANYVMLLDKSTYFGEQFLSSLRITFIYVFVTVPLILMVSLLIAYILSKKIKGVGFFRTAYYIPTVLGTNIAVIIIWRYLFETNGLINQGLAIFGMKPVTWLATSWGAMTSLVLLRVWQFGSTMLIFLNALKNVPESLYEAATVDGAGKFRQFLTITIPIITPIILFNFVMRLVETFQVFNGPMLITQGGPAGSTKVLNMLIYEVAFGSNNDINLGSAMSWILFLIIMVFTILIFRSSRYWVHYSD